MIKGIDVVLIERTSTGKKDDFNMEVFEENEPVIIHNVLVGSPTSEEIVDTLNLYAKKIDYVIAVPKGDKHRWENSRVKFFGNVRLVFNTSLNSFISAFVGSFPNNRR